MGIIPGVSAGPPIVGVNPKQQEEEPTSALEKVLRKKENLAALRYSAAELDRMATQIEREADRMNTPGGIAAAETNGGKTKEIISQAVILLNSGVDPKVVGQILSGTTPLTVAIPGGAAGGGGITFQDIKGILDTFLEVKSDKNKDSVIADLREKVAKLESKGNTPPAAPLDPISYAKQSADAVSTMFQAWKDMGLIKEPAPSSGKNSVEEMRESHRHEERMEAIKADKEHKGEMRKIAAEIPRRIGRGVAQHIREGEDGDSERVAAGDIESIKCGACGKNILVPPDVGDTLICPHCGAKYQKKKENEEEPAGDKVGG